MHLSDYDFWSLCWVEFQGLSEAQGDEDEKENRRFGRVMALLSNQNRGKGQSPKGEEDFIPKRRKDTKAKSKDELSQQINDVFKMFM